MIESRHFSEFFKAVYPGSHGPFPWQSKLAERVVHQGWPGALDVPTGAGKTAAIDVAVFHLAVEASSMSKGGALQRAAPRRVFFIVDRRLVVDDAHARARTIAQALSRATSGVLKDMADALRAIQGADSEGASLGDGKMALRVARLRGGAPRDPDWLRTPSQPAVIVSTVDQIGSRLLFRGYGVRDTMKSVHAGLVGADALYLIDEAHLSTPFVETIDAIFVPGSDPKDVRRAFQAPEFVAPFRVVTLSATHRKPARAAPAPFSLTDEDWKHPALEPRLHAAKPAELIPCESEADTTAFAEAFAHQAWEHSVLGKGSAEVTCVVVNRVRRARQVFQSLRRRIADAGISDDPDLPRIALLTGRTRPLERDRILGGLVERMRAPKGGEPRAPLLVVATQCVEAGADLDFDALITEIAPLDCLRQRFGRLNRTGRKILARATICVATDQIGARAQPDPVYGRALAETWKLLQEKGKKNKAGIVGLDFGIDAARSWLPSPSELRDYLAPSHDGLIVLPAFIDQWSRTSPVPLDDPEVALFLHGPKAAPADVQIVWRADIEHDTADDEKLEQEWKSRVAACPPSSLEMLSVPYWEAVRWLGGEARADIADVEGGAGDEVATDFVRDRVLRWCGSDDPRTRLLRTEKRASSRGSNGGTAPRDRLRPGDTIVVPASRGGCDAWGWTPTSKDIVEDLGAEANARHRRRRILRLSPALLRLQLEGDDLAWRRVNALDEFGRRSCDWSDRDVRQHIEALPSELDPTWFDEMPDELANIDVIRDEGASQKGRAMALAYDLGRSPKGAEQLTTDGSSRAPDGTETDADLEGAGLAVTEDDQSVRGSRRQVELCEHSQGVREFARAFADRVGLNRELASDIALAAFLHDAGKAHPDFKLWLYSGDPFHADSPPLAKSGQRRLPLRARQRANLPEGARHEAASLLLAIEHPAMQQAYDPDLVLWLIGTHHGYGRPFFTDTAWPREGDSFSVDLGDGEVHSRIATAFAELQSAWFDLRVRVHEKYGPWGLARLEAILRLADHRRSEWEQRPESNEETG